jgi:mono/diheme cytochrome c family protein
LPDVIFAGPAGRLEGRYSHAKVAGAPLAIVLHPAPKHGGDMNNAMTRLLYQAFMVRGFSVLRFNFCPDGETCVDGECVADDPNGGGPDAQAGETYYAANCAACHAADGSGGIGPDVRMQTAAQLQTGVEAAAIHAAIAITAEDYANMEAFLAGGM